MQMEIPIQAKGFEGRRLAVQTAGMFSSPKLLIDGTPAKQEKGRYVLRDNAGSQVQAKLIYNHIDPVPKVEIAGDVIQIARSLTWYEYGWGGWPILLLFHGGAIGGMCGALATWSNVRIFRGNRSPVAKYLITGAISILAVVGYVILAMFFVSLVRRR